MQGLEKTARSPRVSLLDDTNDEGCSSLYRGGLTAFDLYKALRRPRWATKTAESEEYVADIDRWTVLSLAASASESQARVLGEFIYRHLEWTTGTRLHNRIITEGIPLYALEFHLPFYALRKHRKTLRDLRTRQTGEPLRQSQDVTFLRTLSEKNDNSGNDIIYQAKVSCLVSGWDRYSWVAYMFIDLYFEESHVDQNLESIADYEQHLSEVRLDPFTAGKTTSHGALREPREYFLQVLAVRLSKTKHEWEHLVLHIEKAIETYMSDYWARFAQTESSSSSEKPGGTAKGNTTRTTLRLEFHEWMKMTTALLRKLINTIQEYIRELDLFFSKGVYYFHSFAHSTNVSGPAIVSLTTIDRVRDELGRLSKKLQNFKDNLSKDISQEVTLRLAHENNESTLSQQAAGRDLRMLTWTTFLSLPIALTAALLSTSQGYIPITPSPRNLLMSILFIEGLVWIALDALGGLRWSRAAGKWAYTQARKVVPESRGRAMEDTERSAEL
ncbi:hypothetical protein DL769_005612 [Monosporascus sp. CRB-8-3]|nr:hypothetical protein DL769_005612 [Monosporascus sp. CRB-8-3]